MIQENAIKALKVVINKWYQSNLGFKYALTKFSLLEPIINDKEHRTPTIKS